MAEPVTNELIYEVLKAMQNRLGDVEQRLTNIEGELHGHGEHLASLVASYAALVGDGVRRSDQMNELRRRIERLERRLDLADPST